VKVDDIKLAGNLIMSSYLVDEVETRLVISTESSPLQSQQEPNAVSTENSGLRLLDSSAPFPVETRAGQLLDQGLQVVFSTFSDRSQLLITRTGKTGTVLQVSRDASKQNPNAFVVSVDLLLGVDTEETTLFARLLASKVLEPYLTAGRPCILGLGLLSQDLEGGPQVITSLVDSVKALLDSTSKQ